ncbi:MAG TPA: hypothetical protein VLN44_11355, partial [Pyrinomonadaceae bacterium]|nr:hypothetical protein [Pyrinomonadaceae bacterium]
TVLRGAGSNWRKVEIMWHRRETRRQTEKTKLNLRARSHLPTHPILSLTHKLAFNLRKESQNCRPDPSLVSLAFKESQIAGLTPVRTIARQKERGDYVSITVEMDRA